MDIAVTATPPAGARIATNPCNYLNDLELHRERTESHCEVHIEAYARLGCVCCVFQGDLYLEFELLFPVHLSQQQKMLIAAGLYLPAKPNTAAGKALRDFEAAYRDAKNGWSSGVLKEEAAGVHGQ